MHYNTTHLYFENPISKSKMSLSRYKVSSMEKYDKEITKLSTSKYNTFTFRSIPIFLSWKGKLAASTKVKIIPTPLLHSFCSAPPPPPPPPPEIESQLRAWCFPLPWSTLWWVLFIICYTTDSDVDCCSYGWVTKWWRWIRVSTPLQCLSMTDELPLVVVVLVWMLDCFPSLVVGLASSLLP